MKIAQQIPMATIERKELTFALQCVQAGYQAHLNAATGPEFAGMR